MQKKKMGITEMKDFEIKVQYLLEKISNNLEMEWYESGGKVHVITG